jgi:hypothetical protein
MIDAKNDRILMAGREPTSMAAAEIVIAENERQVTLRVKGQHQLVLNKSDIQ